MTTTFGGAHQRRRILQVLPATCPPLDEALTALVEQARDDVNAERVDVISALRAVASAAWREGHDTTCERSAPEETDPAPEPRHRRPGGGADDYIVLITDAKTGAVDARHHHPTLTIPARDDLTGPPDLNIHLAPSGP